MGDLSFDLWLDHALSGLFQLLVNPMNIYEDQKMVTLYSLVGECWRQTGTLQRPVGPQESRCPGRNLALSLLSQVALMAQVSSWALRGDPGRRGPRSTEGNPVFVLQEPSQRRTLS